MGRDQTFAIIDAITSEAISPRFTDYAGSVQAVMATDTLLSALVNDGAVSAERRGADPRRHQHRLSRGARPQCVQSGRVPGEPRPGGRGDPEAEVRA